MPAEPVIKAPPDIVYDLRHGFCCNGYQFNIEANQSIADNEILQIYRGRENIGNITKLQYGCNVRGSHKYLLFLILLLKKNFYSN